MPWRNSRTGTTYAEIRETNSPDWVEVRTPKSTWFIMRRGGLEWADEGKDDTPRARIKAMLDSGHGLLADAVTGLLVDLGAAPTWDADTCEKAVMDNFAPLCAAYGLPWVGNLGPEVLEFWEGVKEGG
jgi:hypothetical protein